MDSKDTAAVNDLEELMNELEKEGLSPTRAEYMAFKIYKAGANHVLSKIGAPIVTTRFPSI